MRIDLPKLPPFHRVRLANGLQVVSAELHTVPLVYLSCVVPAGARYDPPGREGLSALMMPLLHEGGTRRRSTAQFTTEAEELGADLLGGVDWETATLGVELLTADLGAGLDLLFDLLLAPRLPPEALPTARQRQLLRLRREQWQPGGLADAELIRQAYGGTIFGRPLLGEEESLGRISPEDIHRFHRRHFRLENTVLAVAGSLAADELTRRLEELPGSLLPNQEEDDPLPTLTAGREPGGSHLLDCPGAPQTEIRLGYPAVPPSHPDAELLELLAWILSRRLRRALRDQRGFTYQARCRFSGSGPSLMRISTAVDTAAAGEAAGLLLDETKRLRQEAIGNDELTEACNHSTGLLLRSFQVGNEIAGRLLRLALEGRPDDHFERTLEQLRHTTSESLRELAGRHLDPSRAVLVFAGPARELHQQLAARGLSPRVSVSDPALRRAS